MFVTEQPLRYKVDEGNVITIGLDTQTVFYQPTSFYTGQNIQIIRQAKLDKYNAMFVIVRIKKLVEKCSWGSYGATQTRLRKSRIYLPATDNGEIDFAFMSAFMKDVENNILNTTLKIFKGRTSVNKSKWGGVKMTEVPGLYKNSEVAEEGIVVELAGVGILKKKKRASERWRCERG